VSLTRGERVQVKVLVIQRGQYHAKAVLAHRDTPDKSVKPLIRNLRG
jgi:hypothetical protein